MSINFSFWRIAQARFRALTKNPPKAFQADDRGAVAVIFGIVLFAVIVAIGVAIDYGRAVLYKIHVQQAADSAILSMGYQATATQPSRQASASNQVTSALAKTSPLKNLVVTEKDIAPQTYEVDVSGEMQTLFLRLVNINSVPISAVARAKMANATGSQNYEIALALDNTGSMSSNMASLKSAANTFVTKVLAGNANNVKISVVPYVAAVNPGFNASEMQYVETQGQSPTNGRWFVNLPFGQDPNCTPVYPGGGGGGPSPTPGPSKGVGGSTSSDAQQGDARDILDIIKPIGRLANQLLGVSTAQAQTIGNITPNTIPPFQTNTYTGGGKSFKIPYDPAMAGSNNNFRGVFENQCNYLYNPGAVSHYDLFARIHDTNDKPVKWKGCVEARLNAAEMTWLGKYWSGYVPPGADPKIDYDVTDTPPNSKAAGTLFVPYFWPDEPDYNPNQPAPPLPGGASYAPYDPKSLGAYSAPGLFNPSKGGFHNNYMTTQNLMDYSEATKWGWAPISAKQSGISLLTYNGSKAAAIQEDGVNGISIGPNASCPDAVLRLTNDQTAVTNKINNLTYWYNGGTVISEGLMWAWRTLSPNPPYGGSSKAGAAQAYNTPGLNKTIVLMTDGVNGLADNNASADLNISDYSAYGYLGGPRLSSWLNVQADASNTQFENLSNFLDERLKTACTNAKKKGINIYTIFFSANIHASTTAEQNKIINHAQTILQDCASNPSFALNASDAASLASAFSTIATSITSQRLVLIK